VYLRIQGTTFGLVDVRLSRVLFEKATKSTYLYWYWYGFVSSASVNKAKLTRVSAALIISFSRTGKGFAGWIGPVTFADTTYPPTAEKATSQYIRTEMNATATIRQRREA
jgi:hypothetical protein